MFFTVFGDQIIKGASWDHKNDSYQYDKIFVDLVKKRIAYAKLNELLSRNTDLELFIVDNVFTAGTDSQTVGYWGYLSDTLGFRMIFGLLQRGRMLVCIKISCYGHVGLAGGLNEGFFQCLVVFWQHVYRTIIDKFIDYNRW